MSTNGSFFIWFNIHHSPFTGSQVLQKMVYSLTFLSKLKHIFFFFSVLVFSFLPSSRFLFFRQLTVTVNELCCAFHFHFHSFFHVTHIKQKHTYPTSGSCRHSWMIHEILTRAHHIRQLSVLFEIVFNWSEISPTFRHFHLPSMYRVMGALKEIRFFFLVKCRQFNRCILSTRINIAMLLSRNFRFSDLFEFKFESEWVFSFSYA